MFADPVTHADPAADARLEFAREVQPIPPMPAEAGWLAAKDGSDRTAASEGHLLLIVLRFAVARCFAGELGRVL
eukprot:scaffold105688_cov32-Tisochrysis_lutea.AAC.5